MTIVVSGKSLRFSRVFHHFITRLGRDIDVSFFFGAVFGYFRFWKMGPNLNANFPKTKESMETAAAASAKRKSFPKFVRTKKPKEPRSR